MEQQLDGGGCESRFDRAGRRHAGSRRCGCTRCGDALRDPRTCEAVRRAFGRLFRILDQRGLSWRAIRIFWRTRAEGHTYLETLTLEQCTEGICNNLRRDAKNAITALTTEILVEARGASEEAAMALGDVTTREWHVFGERGADAAEMMYAALHPWDPAPEGLSVTKYFGGPPVGRERRPPRRP